MATCLYDYRPGMAADLEDMGGNFFHLLRILSMAAPASGFGHG